jgi:Flp pilus assembly protein TadG
VALVEFALVFPVLMLLLLGMVTAGFAYNQKLAITNGVREGSRFGATLPVPSSCASGPPINCWLRQVADVTQSSAEGELASSTTALNICVAYVNDTGLGVDTTTKLTRTGTGDSFSSGTCFGDNLNSYRRVQVTGSRQGRIEFLVGSMTPTLRSEAVTKFEAAQ